MTDELQIVEPAIYEMLKELAAGKVFHMCAKQGDESPYIVYQKIDAENWRHMNGPDAIKQVYIQIDCYHADSFESIRLGAQVEKILDGFAGTVSFGSNSPQENIEIGGISFQNGVDITDQTDEPLLYRNSAVYLVTYKQ